MSGQTVSVTLTVDEAQALKAWTSQQTAVEKLKQKLAKLEMTKDPLSPMKDSAMRTAAGIGQVVTSITGIGGALSGVIALWSQLNREMDATKARQAGAAATNIDLSREITRMSKATGGRLDAQQAKQVIRKGSIETGIPEMAMSQLYGAVFTTAGPQNAKEDADVISTANAVAQNYDYEDAKSLAEIGHSTALVKKEFGLTNAEALGYQQQAQNVSPVKDLHAFAAGVSGKLPGIALAGQFTPAEAAALSGTLGQRGGDQEGLNSAQAALKLANELKERLPHMKTGAERITYMQQHPEAAKAYFEGGDFPTADGKKKHFPAAESGREQFKPHIEALFQPNSLAATEYKKNVESFGDKKKWAADNERMQKSAQNSEASQIAKLNRLANSAKAQLQTNDTGGALASEARTAIEGILAATGETDISQKFSKLKFEVGTLGGTEDPLSQVDAELEEKIASLRSPTSGSVTGNAAREAARGFGRLYGAEGVADMQYQAASYLGFAPAVETTKSPEALAEDERKAKVLEDAQRGIRGVRESFIYTNKNRKASEGFENASDAVAEFEKEKSEEKRRAAQEQLDKARDPIVAAERMDRDKENGGEGRKRLQQFAELEKRLKAAEAAKAPGIMVEPKEEKPVPVAQVVNVVNKPEAPAKPPQTAKEALAEAKKSAKQTLADAEKAAEELANDTTPTEEELHEARQKAKRAGRAVNEYGQESLGELGGGGAAEMFDSFRRLTERLDALANALDANSKATADNNKVTTDNNKITADNNKALVSPAPSTVPVRNNTVTQQQSKPK